ncbi:MAG: thymidine kinase [Candidatus Gastranaerophilales bacterium]|nr:thymidine kinase [Candidatus Gastranaerophilales bacterium]
MGYRFEIITGPMSCGKTEELLRRIRRHTIAKRKVKVISPDIDTRAQGDYIESRNGLWLDAHKVKNARDILNHIEPDDDIIAIDELQFFDREIVPVVNQIIAMGKKIIATGLDLDFKAEPFGSMAELLCYADKVDKLTAICMKCGSDYATRTQRLVDGKPADKNSPLIMIGADETYEARCIDCYELPDKEAEKRKDSKKYASGTKNNNLIKILSFNKEKSEV